MYRTAPLLRPPFCEPTSRKKRGERNNEDLCFHLAVKPPPPPPPSHVLRSTKLCCAIEDKNSFDRHAMAVLELLATYMLPFFGM